MIRLSLVNLHGQRVLAVGDADLLSASLLVGLGPAQVQQQTTGLRLEVGQSEGGELGSAQGSGEAEQKDHGVPDTALGGAVDDGDDLAHVGDAAWSSRAAWCATDDPAQPAADLPDRVLVDGATDAVGAVLVPDGRAGRIDGGRREPLLGALGQVGADRGWLGRERHDSPAGTPAHSSALRVGVDLARGLGVDGGESTQRCGSRRPR